MASYDVRLDLEDPAHGIRLEVYQQVSCDDEREAEIIRLAKQQFAAWAMRQGPDWGLVAMRVPFIAVTASQIQPAGRPLKREPS